MQVAASDYSVYSNGRTRLAWFVQVEDVVARSRACRGDYGVAETQWLAVETGDDPHFVRSASSLPMGRVRPKRVFCRVALSAGLRSNKVFESWGSIRPRRR